MSFDFLVPVLQIFLAVIKAWWWIILPVILYFPLKHIYLWWIGWDIWYKEQKWILLEIKPPKEVLKPFKAMEDVFSRVWGVYDSPNWREEWLLGEMVLPFWLSLEIVSIEGEIHFFIRLLKVHRHSVESAIYAHYPDMEISLADDYTKNVPQDIPNKDWDLYGEAYKMEKDDIYPIKTYEKFFEPTGERIAKEEKRIDPLLSLLESMVKLGKGEQFWFQILALPITNKQIPYVTRGREVVDRLVHRPAKLKGSIVGETARVLVGQPPF